MSQKHLEQMMEFIKEENKIKETTVISPSGKYELIIGTYSTKPGCWEYTLGTVYSVVDKKKIIEIPRNYSSFQHSFFYQKGQEWLQAGITYTSQVFINLDTEEVYYGKEGHFCWSKAYVSPDGLTLAVDGCIWGGPYEYQFYDITDISKGWKEIKMEEDIYESEIPPSWEGDLFVYSSSVEIPTVEGKVAIDKEWYESYNQGKETDLTTICKEKKYYKREGDTINLVKREQVNKCYHTGESDDICNPNCEIVIKYLAANPDFTGY